MENKKRRTWLIVVGVIVALCCCMVVIGGGIGYYFYSTGQLSLGDLEGLLGGGPTEIQIANLSDTTLYVEITYDDDVTTGETYTHSSLELGEFDISIVSGLSAREYQIEFSTKSGSPEGGTCILRVKSGDHLTFVAVPEGIGVVREGDEITSSEEVNILTSPICQGE